MEVRVEGSVRVDLLGGTIDLVPINQILRNTVTLNLATSLKAVCEIKEKKDLKELVIIKSLDYNTETSFKTSDFTLSNFDNGFFGPLSFVCQILHHFKLTKEIVLTIQSGSPPGAGLGGSSSMGVTIYKAAAKYLDLNFDKKIAIDTIQNIESKILNKGPCGYQDYYPALYGGVLALIPNNTTIEVKQLFSKELKEVLESRLTLIYSGELRLSAINNWEVYKDFFDGRTNVREGLSEIADLSTKALHAIENKDYENLLDLIVKEGLIREKLFSNIVTPEIKDFYKKIENLSQGMKMCGAGGGGCFIVVHKEGSHEAIKSLALENKMKVLEFNVCDVL